MIVDWDNIPEVERGSLRHRILFRGRRVSRKAARARNAARLHIYEDENGHHEYYALSPGLTIKPRLGKETS